MGAIELAAAGFRHGKGQYHESRESHHDDQSYVHTHPPFEKWPCRDSTTHRGQSPPSGMVLPLSCVRLIMWGCPGASQKGVRARGSAINTARILSLTLAEGLTLLLTYPIIWSRAANKRSLGDSGASTMRRHRSHEVSNESVTRRCWPRRAG